MELTTRWLSVDVSGWQWMSVDVSGCVNVIFVYQLSFSAYEHHSWLKTVHYMMQTVGVNCPAVQWNSLVLGEMPESVIRTICMIWLIKCQYWKRKTGIKRSEVMICLNDQATIAWLTPTRGVYQVTFSAYEFYWGLKKVHHMQSLNCKSQLSFSAMILPLPIGTREIFSWNNLKVSKLDKQAGNKKIQLKICLNDQATIAWFTSVRGVYHVSFSSSKLC